MKSKSFVCVRIFILIAFLIGLAWTPKPVQAATFIVNSTADHKDADLSNSECLDQYGFCTLRAAIEQINYDGGASNTIEIGALTIPVSTLPRIKKNLTINGQGVNNTIIKGNGLGQGGFDTDYNLVINNLTMEFFEYAVTSNGKRTLNINNSKFRKNVDAITISLSTATIFQTTITENTRYAIRSNSGEFTLNFSTINKNVGNNCAIEVHAGKAFILDSAISENSNLSGNGGAICIGYSGRVTLDNSKVNYNIAAGYGGGISMEGYNSYPELLIMNTNEINNNHATKGGGIYLNGGYLNIEGKNAIVQINHNSATEEGGGIYTSSNKENLFQGVLISNNTAENGGGMYTATSGNFIIQDSAFINNSATAGNGGAIYNNVNHRYILNTTFSGNQATNHGGAIYTKAGIVDLSNVTITENTCNSDSTSQGGQGGGIFIETDSKLNIRNSIVAGNFDIKGATFDFSAPEIHGTITSYGYNLFGVITDWLIATNILTGNQINVSPQLGPLSYDEYAPRIDSFHHPLLNTSPAINGGNPAGCKDRLGNPILLDQLGRERTQLDRCDIGAVESSYDANPIALSGLTLNKDIVVGGNQINASVYINLDAPVGGTVITLEKSIGAPITLPATVTIPEGSKSQAFTINTSTVSENTYAAVFARHGNTERKVLFTLLPENHTQSVLMKLMLSTDRIGGSQTLTGTVKLDIPAPTGGVVISLSSNTPSVISLPASVTIDAGMTSKDFTISTVPVDIDVDVVIFATQNLVTKEAALQVYPLKFVFLPLLTK
jgi:CSLREA domain-containing protein